MQYGIFAIAKLLVKRLRVTSFPSHVGDADLLSHTPATLIDHRYDPYGASVSRAVPIYSHLSLVPILPTQERWPG